MIVKRSIENYIKEVFSYYPILLLIGPRQTGKTTLLKDIFPEYKYISLEDPDVRSLATNDPRGFLETYKDKTIFDEAQQVPLLFSYLQTNVDENNYPGRFVLSGSHNFLLQSSIKQSLVGRVGIVKLFPFDFSELHNTEYWNDKSEDLILNGFYPGKVVKNIPVSIFYPNYISTYIERDVTDLVSVSNLNVFRKFIKLCAFNSGKTMVYNKISNELDISVNTVKNWLSILEMSFIIYTIPHHYTNFGKRITKSAKMYFFDSGLLCNLLEIENTDELIMSKHFGSIFETFIVSQFYKHKAHTGRKTNFTYFRDSNGNEIDFIDNFKDTSNFYEIKSGKTFKPEFTDVMLKLLDEDARKNLIYRGNMKYNYKTVNILPWNEVNY